MIVRTAEPDDVAFIVAGWLQGYQRESPCRFVMDSLDWWTGWHHIVENILADERTKTLVACYEDGPRGRLFGFVCARPPELLHWVYVKQPYRGNGIATELIRLALGGRRDFILTHWSRGARRMQRHAPGLIYDDSFLWEYVEKG